MKTFLLSSLFTFFVIIQIALSQSDSIWMKVYYPNTAIAAKFTNQDTQRIVVGIKGNSFNGDSGAVQLLDALTGNIIWQQLTRSTLAIDISNDSSLVATAHADTTIRIWDLNTGQLKKTYNRVLFDTLDEGLYAKFTSICFSNNGRYVYTAYNYYPSLYNFNKTNLFRIDLQNDSIIHKLTYDNQEIIKMSPTSDTLISTVGRYSYPAIAKINPNTLQLDTILYVGQGGLLTDIAISPNGNYIATSSENGTVKIWNMSDLSLSKTFSTNEESVYYGNITFSNNNLYLILAKRGRSINDWVSYIIKIDNDSIVYEYNYSASDDIEISTDDQYIVFSDEFVKLYYSRNISGAYREQQYDEINSILYPNPTTGFLNFEFDKFTNNSIKIVIYSEDGKFIYKIYEGRFLSENFNIKWNTSHLDKGIYFIVAKGKNYSQTYKLVKE